MEQQIIELLNTYDARVKELTTEITNDEAAIAQKRTTLEQVRGAFAAMYTLAIENDIIKEETTDATDEVTPVEPEVEVVEQ